MTQFKPTKVLFAQVANIDWAKIKSKNIATAKQKKKKKKKKKSTQESEILIGSVVSFTDGCTKKDRNVFGPIDGGSP